MKGIIYKIQIGDDLYIGSSESTIENRQKYHNKDLKKYPHRKLYKQCIEQGIEKIKCIWVADIEFNSTIEKREIEEKYRKDLNANLNMKRCYITEQERIENKRECDRIYEKTDKVKEYRKQYREKNKEAIKAKRDSKKEQKKEYDKLRRINYIKINQ